MLRSPHLLAPNISRARSENTQCVQAIPSPSSKPQPRGMNSPGTHTHGKYLSPKLPKVTRPVIRQHTNSLPFFPPIIVPRGCQWGLARNLSRSIVVRDLASADHRVEGHEQRLCSEVNLRIQFSYSQWRYSVDRAVSLQLVDRCRWKHNDM
jgi:hypothetical protein